MRFCLGEGSLPGRASVLPPAQHRRRLADSAAEPCLARACLDLGPAACLQRLAPALRGLHTLLEQGIGGPLGSPLKRRILEVAAASPLLAWLARQEEGRLAEAARGGAAAAGEGPAACGRLGALLQILGELRERYQQQDGQQQQQEGGRQQAAWRPQQRVVVVASSQAAAAALLSSLRSAPQLHGASMCLLDQGPEAGCTCGSGEGKGGGGGGGSLEVMLLTRGQLASGVSRGLVGARALVWYCASGIVSASSHDLESSALFACHQACAAAAAASADDGGPGSHAPPLQCLVLASAGQAAAVAEARRIDRTLQAAMQMAALGDAAFEERLAQLADPGGAPEQLEGEAPAALEAVTLGLTGQPPRYSCAAAVTDHDHSGSGDDGQAGDVEKHYVCTLTLPAADFPPEKFTPAPASMPTAPVSGWPRGSEAAAAAAAALRALRALHELGIIARYWPTRLLLAQHLLPWQPTAAGRGGSPEPGRVPVPGAGAGAGVGGDAVAAGNTTGSSPEHFCGLCNVDATGDQASRAPGLARVITNSS